MIAKEKIARLEATVANLEAIVAGLLESDG